MDSASIAFEILSTYGFTIKEFSAKQVRKEIGPNDPAWEKYKNSPKFKRLVARNHPVTTTECEIEVHGSLERILPFMGRGGDTLILQTFNYASQYTGDVYELRGEAIYNPIREDEGIGAVFAKAMKATGNRK